MLVLLRLAVRSLRSRLLTTSLTVFSIALSVLLLVGIDRLRSGAQQGFAGTVSGVDLVVGARSGPLPLLLSSVFHIGDGANDISFETYAHFRDHPAVAWTIPFSMGDSHRGYRVVGTDENFYKHYSYRGGHAIRFTAGRQPGALFDCVLGSDVAERLRYGLGSRLVLAHGLESVSLMNHADKPFTVSGILARTSTPVDRAIYISLLGVEAMHVDWSDGTPPALGEAIPAAHIDPKQLHVDQISAFLVRTRTRISTLPLQREINTYEPEPLTAAIPALTLAELWHLVGYADSALSLVSAAALVIGLLSMVAILYTTLNERRREIAILRALGLSARQVLQLLILETTFISLAGTLLGFAGAYSLLVLARSPVEQRFGIPLLLGSPSPLILGFGCGIVLLGAILGSLPALQAYRNSLADGLSVR